jgi:putative pyruvate formate lyase activating enzyme
MEELTKNKLSKCEICPRKCKVNRISGKKGYCKLDDKIYLALVSTHYFEEPCISGKKGSGTIFFSNCNLSCIFCQNHEISQEGKGKEVTIERLAEIMLEQQSRGVNNINLVTPTMYAYHIIEAIKIARSKGLTIPIVYNTNGYENVETLKDLEGFIDIYLPDLKYFDNEAAIKFSKAPNYFEIATEAIKEMARQTKENVFNEDGIMQKGMIIRHLVLPNHIQNSKHVLKWIKDNLPEDTMVSIMAQYFPTYKVKTDESFKDINRKLNMKEYKEIEDYVFSLNLENGYMQDLGEHEEEFVPNFDFRNI